MGGARLARQSQTVEIGLFPIPIRLTEGPLNSKKIYGKYNANIVCYNKQGNGIDSFQMQENGITHFTKLHRSLHKNFLIWHCQNPAPVLPDKGIVRRARRHQRSIPFILYRFIDYTASFFIFDTASIGSAAFTSLSPASRKCPSYAAMRNA